ncbi:hypothetical protein C8N36_103288 [Pelagimonas varians]|uniref:Uncharacterized protein n=1 Tax=Pelagimonas varians TaxID=696760 RepID=A0A238KTD0_9RHOB|nr:hypothetical protein C8N36_103288 [Pelagimonas varians]SMX45861.1 hypothetical protein PEV8663_03132 [Pelagimonas varians]
MTARPRFFGKAAGGLVPSTQHRPVEFIASIPNMGRRYALVPASGATSRMNSGSVFKTVYDK